MSDQPAAHRLSLASLGPRMTPSARSDIVPALPFEMWLLIQLQMLDSNTLRATDRQLREFADSIELLCIKRGRDLIENESDPHRNGCARRFVKAALTKYRFADPFNAANLDAHNLLNFLQCIEKKHNRGVLWTVHGSLCLFTQIAETLKKLTYINIDFNGKEIMPHSGLADALSGEVKELRVWNGKIDYFVDHHISNILDNAKLEVLSLRRCGLRDFSAQRFANALQSNTTLVSLDLSDNTFRIAQLANALKSNTTLQNLVLKGNRFVRATDIADLLTDNATLQNLDLRGCGIGAAGGAALADALKRNTTLQYLDLRDNRIEETGAAALAAALETNKTLKSLVIETDYELQR